MSDTPRIDANSGWCVGMYGIIRCSELFIDQDGPYVDVRFARELERENAALREDKERLDWLTNSLGWIVVGYQEADPSQHATEDNTLADAWRAAIDAARKEAKP